MERTGFVIELNLIVSFSRKRESRRAWGDWISDQVRDDMIELRASEY